MNDLRQAAQQALKASDALEKVRGPFDEKGVATVPFFYLREFGAAMEELRQALAEPEQEPVACIGTNGELMWLNKPKVIYTKPIPLYTAPTPRKPVELTDWDIVDIYNKWDATPGVSMADFARAVIAAYEAKNGITREQT